MSLAPLRSVLLLSLTLIGCDKTETNPTTSASATPTAMATPAATSATVTASAEPSAASSASAPTASAPTASASASADVDAGDCGTKPLPDCPLQAWMKSNLNPPVMNKNAAALAAPLEKVIAFAPPNYPNWVSITKDGIAAARAGDLDAAKASCRTCHDQYKKKYKAELRARKI